MVVRDSRVRKFSIPKGVRAFDFCKHSNVLVSGGVDGYLRIWNPHVNHHANAVLEGHKASILAVAIRGDDSGPGGRGSLDAATHKAQNQFIVSMSADVVVKLWSMRTHSCLMSLSSSFLDAGEHQISACHYDTNTGCMLYANEQLHGVYIGDGLISGDQRQNVHNGALTEVSFNPLFGQVVTACRQSTLNVWNLATGERVLKFGPGHANAEVTRMSFDRSQRRLLTAASDGSIKLWNFNVGVALMKLQSDMRVELQAMLELQDGRILAGGWGRTLNVFTQCDGSSYYVAPDREAVGRGHTADITGVAELRPIYIASCAINGEVITWKVLDRVFPLRQHNLRGESV